LLRQWHPAFGGSTRFTTTRSFRPQRVNFERDDGGESTVKRPGRRFQRPRKPLAERQNYVAPSRSKRSRWPGRSRDGIRRRNSTRPLASEISFYRLALSLRSQSSRARPLSLSASFYGHRGQRRSRGSGAELAASAKRERAPSSRPPSGWGREKREKKGNTGNGEDIQRL